jgi:hypothetical protein
MEFAKHNLSPSTAVRLWATFKLNQRTGALSLSILEAVASRATNPPWNMMRSSRGTTGASNSRMTNCGEPCAKDRSQSGRDSTRKRRTDRLGVPAGLLAAVKQKLLAELLGIPVEHRADPVRARSSVTHPMSCACSREADLDLVAGEMSDTCAIVCLCRAANSAHTHQQRRFPAAA